MDDFNMALSLNKNNVNALIGRGNLRKLLTQMSEALKDFNDAIKLNPNNDKAYYSRGNWKLS